MSPPSGSISGLMPSGSSVAHMGWAVPLRVYRRSHSNFSPSARAGSAATLPPLPPGLQPGCRGGYYRPTVAPGAVGTSPAHSWTIASIDHRLHDLARAASARRALNEDSRSCLPAGSEQCPG